MKDASNSLYDNGLSAFSPKKRKGYALLALAAVLAVGLLAGCNNAKSTAAEGPAVIRIAHNWPREMDTTFRDPITGEPGMGQEELNARVYAEQQVLEKLNVQLQWIAYPSDLNEDILRSVLANDPIAELVRIVGSAQGLLLGQNVLQPLDEFQNLFADEDSSWMFWGKAFDHNYFLNNVMRYGNDAPLCYNIGMLEKVDALKVNGKTVLPVDLWKEGRWTWSVFEDYLQKVNDYWIQDWDGRIAYDADYRVAAMMAMHANGASVYGDRGLEIDTPQAKEAVAYIERLMSKNLIRNVDMIAGTSDWGGLMDVWRFQWGHSVFSNLQQWLAGDMVGQFNDRGETMGIVPFPRPDSMAANDPNYRQLNDAKDCYAVPKGISREKAELAVKAFREYTVSYYKRLAGSDRALDYLQADGSARSAALKMFLDITNEDYGQDLLDAWKYLGSTENMIVNEYARNVGILDFWGSQILGDSLYGVKGAAPYAIQVASKMGQVNEMMNTIQSALNSSGVHDNIAPRFSDVEGAALIFASGTAPSGINWGQYLTVQDNIDGALDFSKAAADYAGVNFDKPGRYDNGVSFSIKDAAGNTGTASRTVTVYNGSNTTPPRLVIKGEYRTINLDESTAGINWKDDFVDSATDRDGLDLRDRVAADLSEINTTAAGEYPVVLTVTDYAGNTASAPVTVIVQ
jgi:hypothetical protein